MLLRIASVFNPSKLVNVTVKRFPLKDVGPSMFKNLLITVAAVVILALGAAQPGIWELYECAKA